MSEIAEAFPPGEFIADELLARDWTIRDLAERMGGDVSINEFVVSILVLARPKGLLIGNDTAAQLGKAFKTSPEFWLNLDLAWQKAEQPGPKP